MMGAETTIWVEIEVVTKIWRRSYGVTRDDGLENVEIYPNERLTGRAEYEVPEDGE
jgi:hypothetical protein